jgi:DNA-directed RNA polymerase subunit RPC12/RpoP
MNLINKNNNHEIWHNCDKCGKEVDIRKELDTTNCHCGGKLK